MRNRIFGFDDFFVVSAFFDEAFHSFFLGRNTFLIHFFGFFSW